MADKTTAGDIMTRRLITFRATDSISHAISVLVKNRISGAPVVGADDRLIGVLSEKDCMRVLVHEFYETSGPALSKTVGELMSKDVHSIDPGLSLVRVAEAFMKNPFRRLPVVDGDRLVGQVSRHDVLVAVYKLTGASPRERDPTEQGDMVSGVPREGASVVGPQLNRAYDKKIE